MDSHRIEKLRDWLERPYELALRNVVLPLGDRVFGQGMMDRLRFLQQAQWWPREKVLEYRDQQLRQLMAVAWSEVPFYRDLMQQAGVKPQDIRTVADLTALPIVNKDMFRINYPQRTCRPTRGRHWESCSSGSTGQNFCVRQDMETAGRLRALTTLAFGWGGWPLGAAHLQTGMTLKRGSLKGMKDRFLRCHYESAYDLSDEHLDHMLGLIRRYSLRHLRGYAGSLYVLARRAHDTGMHWRMDSIISWGDNLYQHYRAALEETFSCRVTDTYGCAEGIQVCGQCGQGLNYHIYSTDVVVEIVDDDGHPVPAGTTGHILLTRLHPGPMPLIRYRVGDLGIHGGEKVCECGRGWELLGSIQGRDTDVVITPSGNRLIVHYFTGILEHFKEIHSFQVVQEQVESIRLLIVPTQPWSDEMSTRVIAALHEKGADDLQIQIELVDEIPLPPSKKRRFVVSRIAAQQAAKVHQPV